MEAALLKIILEHGGSGVVTSIIVMVGYTWWLRHHGLGRRVMALEAARENFAEADVQHELALTEIKSELKGINESLARRDEQFTRLFDGQQELMKQLSKMEGRIDGYMQALKEKK